MKRFVTVIAASAMFAVVSAPAFAQQRPEYSCDSGQGTEYLIDFKWAQNMPLMSLPRRILSQKCVEGETTYQLKGMPGIYKSEDDAIYAYNAFNKLRLLGVKPEDAAAGFAYTQRINDAAIGDEPKSTAEKK